MRYVFVINNTNCSQLQIVFIVNPPLLFFASTFVEIITYTCPPTEFTLRSPTIFDHFF